MKKLLVLLSFLLFLTGCQVDTDQPSNDSNTTETPSGLSQISVSQTTLQLNESGASSTLDVVALTSNGFPDTFTAVSSNINVAVVTKTTNSITITPLLAGNATITLTSSSGLTCTVDVSIGAGAPATLTTNVTSVVLAANEIGTLTVTALSSDGMEENFNFSVSDTSVLNATKNGTDIILEPLTAGSTALNITSASGLSRVVGVTITEGLNESSFSMKDAIVYVGKLRFFDSGGLLNNYGLNENSTVTFYPINPDDNVSISFNSFKVGSADGFYLSNDLSIVLYNHNGISNPADFTSYDNDGKIVVKIVSGTFDSPYIDRTGWDANITTSITDKGFLALSQKDVTLFLNEAGIELDAFAQNIDGTPDPISFQLNNSTLATALSSGNKIVLTAVSEGNTTLQLSTVSGIVIDVPVNVINRPNEGTKEQPVIVELNATHSGKVGKYGGVAPESFYTFNSGNQSGYFTVELKNVVGSMPTLGLYSLNDYDMYNSYIASGGSNGVLTFTAEANTTYYLKVEGSTKDSFYDVNIVASMSEGDATNPVPLALDTKHRGVVTSSAATENTQSYYAFNSSVAGNYTFTLANVNNQHELKMVLYSESNNSEVCTIFSKIGYNQTTCILEALTAYYGIVSYDIYNAGYSYYDVEMLSLKSSGTIENPVNFTSDSLKLYASGGAYGINEAYVNTYSTFNVAQSGKYTLVLHDISLGNFVPQIHMYDDANYSNFIPDQSFNTWSHVSYDLVAGTDYYVKTTHTDGVSVDFNLTILPALSDGTQAAPQLIQEDVRFTGHVGAETETLNSYYAFTPSQDSNYNIRMEDRMYDYDVRMTIHDTLDFNSTDQPLYNTYTHSKALLGGVTYYILIENDIEVSKRNFKYSLLFSKE